MKRWLSVLMIAVMLIGCVLGTYAMAEEASQTVKTTGSVNVRSGPGLSYKTLGSVKKGTTFEYQGEKKKDERGVVWYRVKYNGTTKAWVSSRYTKLSGESSSSGGSSSGGSSSGSSSSGSSSSAKDDGYGFVKSKGNVNIRKGPGTEYKGLGSVGKGTKLPYQGESYKDSRGVTWYRVRFNGTTKAWISGTYSSLTKGSTTVKTSSASKAPATTKAPAADTTPKPTATPKPLINYGKVQVTESLNVRTGPGLDFESIGTVANKTLSYQGDACTDDRGVTWYRVSFDGRIDAWVSSKYASLVAGATTVSNGTAGKAEGYVKATANVNLRIGPGTVNDKVAGMSKGQKLNYMGAMSADANGDLWYMVKTSSGKMAWVISDYAVLDDGKVVVAATPVSTPTVSVWADDLNWFSESTGAEPVSPFAEGETATDLAGQMNADVPVWENEAVPGIAGTEGEFSVNIDLDALPVMNHAEEASAISGTVSEAQIVSALGAANAGQFVNTTGMTGAGTEGDLVHLQVGLANGVFAGGVEGYKKAWQKLNGVVSVFKADLDGDMAEEFAVVYVRPDENGGLWRIAAFEPVQGGYQFADEMTVALSESGQRFVRLTDTASGKGIFTGSIAYLDGDAAVAKGVVYTYSNGKFLGEALFSATNVAYSYVLHGKKFTTDAVETIDHACQNYPYRPAEANQLGIQENMNFESLDLGGYKPARDMVSGKILEENFAGIQMISGALGYLGVEAGYEIFTDADGAEGYSVILAGGETVLNMNEGFEEGGFNAYVELSVKNSLIR